MGLLCKSVNGKVEVTWKNIDNAYVSAITVCQLKLDTSLRQKQKINSVIILGAPPDDNITWLEDVQSKVMSNNYFDNVDILLVTDITPSLEQLKNYGAVFVFSDTEFANADLLGTTLANYVDGGYGGVVEAVFNNNDWTYLQGRWLSENYSPIIPLEQDEEEGLTLGTINLPNHPIMKNVETLDGGLSSYHGTGNLSANSIEIAQWSNERPLVAEKLGLNSRVVMLNFYPPSIDVREDFWDTNTDGALLMGNALKYVIG